MPLKTKRIRMIIQKGKTTQLSKISSINARTPAGEFIMKMLGRLVTVVIKNDDNTTESRVLSINLRTTASEMIRDLGLSDDYVLCSPDGDTVFAAAFEIYDCAALSAWRLCARRAEDDEKENAYQWALIYSHWCGAEPDQLISARGDEARRLDSDE